MPSLNIPDMPDAPITFVERGPLLVGINNEVRALAMGAAAINSGSISVLDAHHFLREQGYDLFHEMQPTHIRTLAKRTPDSLVNLALLDEEDVIELRPLGVASVALAGTLMEDVTSTDEDYNAAISSGPAQVGFDIDFGVDHHSLVGGNKSMLTVPPQTPAPSIRLAIYDTLLSRYPEGKSTGHIRMGVEPLGATQKGIRKHFEALEDRGFITNDGPPLAVRTLTAETHDLIQSYSDAVHRFMEEPDTRDKGLMQMEEVLAGSKTHKIPYLVKRSLASTTSSDGPVLRRVNEAIGKVFKRLPEGVQLTTTDLACQLGLPVHQVTSHLNRMVRNLGTEAAATTNGHRAKGNERIWQSANSTQTPNR